MGFSYNFGSNIFNGFNSPTNSEFTPESLGNKLTMWLDYNDSSTYTLKTGVATTHVAGAANTSTNGCTHLHTASHAIFDYRASGTGVPSPTTPQFSVIHSFVPYGTIFNDTATVNEHILCSRVVNMTSGVGWALYAHKSGTNWYLGCYFDGYKFRSNELLTPTGTDAIGQIGLRWNPSASAGQRVEIFINGTKCTKTTISGSEPSAASTTAPDANSGPIVGWWYGHSSAYSTIVKSALVNTGFGYWQRPLSDSEFTSFYNNGISLSNSTITSTYSPAAYWPFTKISDGVSTGTSNQHEDIVGGKLMIPKQGVTAGVWLSTERPAKTIYITQRITNKAYTGGYINLGGGNAIEYRETSVTIDAPTYGTRQIRLNDMKGQRRARLLNANLDTILNHSDGLIMYCARYDAFDASEGWDIDVITREDFVTGGGSEPNAYMIAGYGTYLGTNRLPILRTENANTGAGGAYVPTSIAAPSTSTPYLISILKIGSNYWYRRTKLTDNTVIEQQNTTVSNPNLGFWWPSTTASQGKSFELLNIGGHVYTGGSQQYFGQMIIAKDISYNQMLDFEEYIKSNL